MQKVSRPIIFAIVVVDSVVVAEFVISAVPSTLYVASKVAYFGGWARKNFFIL